MKWKQLFRLHILERGYDYYLDDKVKIIEKSEKNIVAEVAGSEIYNVNIGLKNDTVEYMECDCPYAMDGKYCKHMAATLYRFLGDVESDENADGQKESDYFERQSKKIKEKKEEVETLLLKIPDSEKHKLLVELLYDDSTLFTSLKLKYDFEMDAEQYLQLMDEIHNIVNEHSERGFIDWSHAYDFCWDLKGFLENRVELLIENNYLMQAFDLNNQVFRLIGTVDMDDSDGGSVMVAEKCYEIWTETYHKADDQEKIKIKEYFNNYKEGSLIDWIEEYLIEFMRSELASVEDLADIMSELDRLLLDCGNSNDCGWVYSAVGGRVSVIEKRIEYMVKLGATKEEVESFCNQNRQFYVVRNMEIERAITNGEFEKAISLIKESKRLDKENYALIERYSQRLIELYKKTGDTAHYVEELKFNLLNCRQMDAGYFKELKANIGNREDWSSAVEVIIDKTKGNHAVYAILAEEKRYSQMMDMLDESHNNYTMDKYVKILSKTVPDRVIKFYTDFVTKEMERASDRKHYKDLVKYLKTMSFCEDGKSNAKKIAEGWKVIYRRRPALLDELRKAGF